MTSDPRHERPFPRPARFVAEHAAGLPVGRTLDLAAGRGRNAVHLAGLGHRVVAVDLERPALDEIRALDPAIALARIDLDRAAFRPASVDSIVCVNFLDRTLWPHFATWLRPGGMILLDTFLVDQRSLGHPRNPAFLLERNELLRAFASWRVLAFREGRVADGETESFRSGIVAELGADARSRN